MGRTTRSKAVRPPTSKNDGYVGIVPLPRRAPSSQQTPTPPRPSIPRWLPRVHASPSPRRFSSASNLLLTLLPKRQAPLPWLTLTPLPLNARAVAQRAVAASTARVRSRSYAAVGLPPREVRRARRSDTPAFPAAAPAAPAVSLDHGADRRAWGGERAAGGGDGAPGDTITLRVVPVAVPASRPRFPEGRARARGP